ncbi:hypothetical protein MLD38_019569 [Melastoma candidum]|uniref:Uncharacterized protein n=1 Tax=Melastoma candidum TaxID=119954 RepID=A0ACB9QZA2_9MYRT|nr:hypothetical protein MLD38_019569 [Melastoma candidum]
MAVAGRPNGGAPEEGDNVEEQNYGVLEEDGLEDQLDHHTIPHLSAVVAAIENEDVDALRRALDDLNDMNIDINEAVEDSDTALHLACLYGQLPCVQLLLERGAGLEIKDEDGAIPLHDACAGGYKEIVQHLLSTARSPYLIKRMLETVESEGDTPLHHAARGEHAEVIRILLAAGADPKRRNIYGKTPVELLDEDSDTRRIFEEFDSNVPGIIS